MTKLGPKVRLFMTPIPTIGFCDAVCAALAIAREAHSNTHFIAKVAQDSGGVTKLGPKVCLFKTLILLARQHDRAARTIVHTARQKRTFSQF